MSASVGEVQLSWPLREGAGASRKAKICGRKNQAMMATAKNAMPILMILDLSSSMCSIRVIRASSRGPRGREGSLRRPATWAVPYELKKPSSASARASARPRLLNPRRWPLAFLLACGELLVLLFFLLLFLDLVVAA